MASHVVYSVEGNAAASQLRSSVEDVGPGDGVAVAVAVEAGVLVGVVCGVAVAVALGCGVVDVPGAVLEVVAGADAPVAGAGTPVVVPLELHAENVTSVTIETTGK